MRRMLAIALSLLCFSINSCKKEGGSSSSGNEIVLGEYASMSGGTASFGLSSHEGILLAMDEINNQGGVLGKKIKVISEDDRSDANEAVTAVQKLISRDKVLAILGEVASKRSLAGANVCQKERIPMLSPASTNNTVTEVGDYIFRICFTDDFQGRVCADFAGKRNWKRVAIFTDVANDYSKGLTRSFKDAYARTDGKVGIEESYRENDNDFKGQLANIKNANVQAVFVPGYYTEVGKILRQARELGLTIPFFGGDGWDDPQTYRNLGTISDGCYFTNHYAADDPSPQVQAFIKTYSARFKNADGSPKIPDAMAILGYDSLRVMADAIKRAGKADSKAVRDALAATKDFPGASGKITIDENRNARKPILILELRGGDTHMVDSITPK